MGVLDVAASTTSVLRHDAAQLTVSEVVFGSGCRLPTHEHPRACVAVVVGGAVRKAYATTTHEAQRASVVVMPAAEPHADVFGSAGARLVVVESERSAGPVAAFPDWGAAVLAHRMHVELAAPDAYSPLALEGLALELLAVAARAQRVETGPWIADASEILRDRFRDPPGLGALAAEVGVHPSRLARGFRARFGLSPGEFVRALRVDWAAQQLLRSDVPLARIACEAGFADQSHFTRAFSARYGVPPGRYRRALR